MRIDYFCACEKLKERVRMQSVVYIWNGSKLRVFIFHIVIMDISLVKAFVGRALATY